MQPKLIRITTVAVSLRGLLKGQHKYMSENGFEVVGVSSSGTALDDVEKNEGIRTVSIEMTRQITPLRDLKALFHLVRLMKKEKPDIVHTHTPKAGLLGMIAARLSGVPNRLHTVAGMPLTVATGVKRKLLNIMEKVTYACATNVYPNSYGLKDLILEYGFTKKYKLKVIGKGSSNGVDTSQFDRSLILEETKKQIRNDLGIEPDHFVFLFVGRVVADKGVNELVQAFDNLKHNASHLIIVGNQEKHLDPLSPITNAIINSNPHIYTVGFKENVVDYFATADVLVFPSYREGFPNVVMQAASMQLNCIVSNINGCNEIISHGKNGWIVPVQNIDQLQERMKWCLENPEASMEMGLNSRQLMQRDYERKFVQSELLKEYKKLVGLID